MMDREIDEIVKQVIQEVKNESGKKAEARIREKGKAAYLRAAENYEIRTYNVPEPGDGEILVKMDGCLVNQNDASEFLKGIQMYQHPVIGSDGAGTVVKAGTTPVKDRRGNIIKEGDRVIALRSVSLNKSGYSEKIQSGKAEKPSCGWYSEYLLLREDMELLKVNDLDLESAILYRQASQAATEAERIFKLYKPENYAKVVVAGCQAMGLLEIAVWKCCGFTEIIAIDTDEERLNLAKKMGAKTTIRFQSKIGMTGVIEEVKAACGGRMADIVLQCVKMSNSTNVMRRLIKEGGRVADLTKDFKVQMTRESYKHGEKFLHLAAQKCIPLYCLVTHRFHLEELNQANWTVLSGKGILSVILNR